jgi:hypothetical protein
MSLPRNPEKTDSTGRFINHLRNEFGVSEDALAFIARSYSRMANERYGLKVKTEGQRRALRHFNIKDSVKAKDIMDKFNVNIEESAKQRPMVHPKERYLEVIEKGGGKCKITINPCDGRVSLKLSHVYTKKFHDECIRLVDMVQKHNNFKPFTYRGTVQFGINTGDIRVTLQPESKFDTRQFVLKMTDADNISIDDIIIQKK